MAAKQKPLTANPNAGEGPIRAGTLAALALLCAPATALSQPPVSQPQVSPPQVQTMSAPMSARTYVEKAGASDLFERQSAQLMRTSKKPEIVSFAEMMVRDHMKSTQAVTAAARRAKMKVAAPRLTSKQASDLAALRSAEGAERDRLYVEQQKAAHEEALAVHSAYASEGKAGPLKAAASKIVPVVKHHIALLDTMK